MKFLFFSYFWLFARIHRLSLKRHKNELMITSQVNGLYYSCLTFFCCFACVNSETTSFTCMYYLIFVCIMYYYIMYDYDLYFSNGSLNFGSWQLYTLTYHFLKFNRHVAVLTKITMHVGRGHWLSQEPLIHWFLWPQSQLISIPPNQIARLPNTWSSCILPIQ